MSWTKYKDELERFTQDKYDESIKLHTKDNWVSKAIAWILFVISCGCLKRETYLKRTATTLAHAHFYPEEWSIYQVLDLLPHEGRHTQHQRAIACGLHPTVGLLPYGLVYLFFPVPILGAFGRLFIEMDADKQQYREHFRYSSARIHPQVADRVTKHALRRADTLASATYLYAVPKSVARWFYKRMVNGVINEFYQAS